MGGQYWKKRSQGGRSNDFEREVSNNSVAYSTMDKPQETASQCLQAKVLSDIQLQARKLRQLDTAVGKLTISAFFGVDQVFGQD